MANESREMWVSLSRAVEKLQRAIVQSKAIKVNASSLKEQAQSVVQLYFRQTRSELQFLGIDSSFVGQLDEAMQGLLRLSKASHSKKSYLGLLKSLTPLMLDVSGAIELRHGEKEFLSRASTQVVMSSDETIIYETLLRIIPTGALSYRQALLDLAGQDRISYRGVATELREALRETLDHLAPDKDVLSQQGFRLEKDRNAPTMKQKVRFILRAREVPESALKAPENAVEVLEERVASFTRSVYERSSISTHVATQRNEVLQVKNYVDIVLVELLGIQS